MWEGDVYEYALDDHPEAETYYAWAEPNEDSGKDRIVAVLKLGPYSLPQMPCGRQSLATTKTIVLSSDTCTECILLRRLTPDKRTCVHQ